MIGGLLMDGGINKTGGLADKALEKGLEDNTNPQEADENLAQRFNDLLSTQQPTNIGGAQGAEASKAAEMTMGDKILQGMQGLRDHVEAKKNIVQSHLEHGEVMDMQTMFKTQMAMTNLMLTEDYIGKIVSKSTQTFDTLLRNQ